MRRFATNRVFLKADHRISRLVPTRNTDFGHLRDGFVRALSARQKSALKSTSLSTEQSDTISESISTFKNFFPNSSVPKGQELLLVRTFDGKLAVEYQGKSMGVLNDPWVAKEMMLAYFADQSVPSQAVSRHKGSKTSMTAC